MKFVTYSNKTNMKPRFGFVKNNYIFDILNAGEWLNSSTGNSSFMNLPSTLKEALSNWWHNFELFKELNSHLAIEEIESMIIDGEKITTPIAEATLFAPVHNPQSFRDFYAFEQHVLAARKLRGLEMHPDWFRIPIFYFSNAVALFGHKENIPYPKGTNELDFELEFAIIIADGGANISNKNAKKHIAGYTICNDWSARDLQREEMAMNLGPAKGKDFATSFGPYMVTPDEIADDWQEDGKLNLRMTCKINGKLISDGNTNDLYHPFTKMIERASLNTELKPGDYIGSGTVGTGCILELRPENTNGWLKKGDTITLEVDKLGALENKIV